MQSINVFHKGIVNDIDVSKRDNQSWDFPTLNARVVNKEGQGYIITNIKGNSLDVSNPNNTIGMMLPQTFAPIGACEYNGIVYILSWSESFSQGEIGCYPSPARISNVDYNVGTISLGGPLTGFQRKYKPLVNFGTELSRKPFRTPGFELDFRFMADMFAAPSFDGSVDIYIADGKNLNRVINSGFNQEGEILSSKIYTDESFPYIVSHVPLVNKIPQRTSLVVESGGAIKSGNYHIYLRYVTKNLNRTKIIKEIGPVSIVKGSPSDIYSIEGIRGDSGTTGTENISDKRIRLTLSNLDTNYQYVEVLYVRSWADDSGIPIQEAFVIDDLYSLNNDTETIILSGYETVIGMPLAEIMNTTIKDLTSETHTIVQDRYFGANWKRYAIHDDRLYQHARRIVPSWKDGNSLSQNKLDINIGYKDYSNVLDKMGYFRLEAIPIGVVYVFKGGIESDVYPTAGIDDRNDYHIKIQEGLYRFPSHAISHPNGVNHLNIISLYFDLTSTNNMVAQSANSYYNINKQWFDDNIIGYYFVRGERFKNMQYQGVMIYGCRAYRVNKGAGYLGEYPGIVEQYNESDKLFNSGTRGDDPKGLLPHGCSNIDWKLSDKTTDFYNESHIDSLNGKRDGLLKGDGSSPVGSEWAIWVGQAHKNYAEDQAQSNYWGANRTNSVGSISAGGKDDRKSGHGDSNGCLYNDHWMEDGEEKGLVMPIWKGFFPSSYVNNKGSNKKMVAKNYHSRAYYVEKKYGLFSPDYILDRSSKAPNGGAIRKISVYTYDENEDGDTLAQASRKSGKDKDTYPWWWKVSITGVTPYGDYDALENAKFTDVSKYTRVSAAKNGFVSEYTDPGFDGIDDFGFTQSSTCMWHWYDTGNRVEGAGNRSMSTAKYIGITLNSHVDGLNLSTCAIYQKDPMKIGCGEIVKYFDLKNQTYSIISELVGLEILNVNVYGGDCFLQQTFIKQMAWRGSTWSPLLVDEVNWSGADKDKREESWLDKDAQELINFGHGLVIPIVTENAMNCELRSTSNLRTFYPRCGEDGLKSFAVYNPDTSDKTESLILNMGYNVLLSPRIFKNYNLQLPFNTVKNETRIRYSEPLIPGSFINSFRSMPLANYEDFDVTKGPIKRIFNHLGYLVSYQKEAINLHYIGDRQAKVDTDQGELFMGSGEVLAKEVKVLSNNGIQHRFGVVKGDRGIMSLDWNKRTINFI
jgi:hypothetical protein